MNKLDPDAILVALVLDPTTYSRNRFFEWYRDPSVRRIRRRATQVRSLIRHLAPMAPEMRRRTLQTGQLEDGLLSITYEIPKMGVRRTMRLSPLEIALVRTTLRDADLFCPREAPPAEDDQARVREALGRLVG